MAQTLIVFAHLQERQTEDEDGLTNRDGFYSATLAAVSDSADKVESWTVLLLDFLTLTLKAMVFFAAL